MPWLALCFVAGAATVFQLAALPSPAALAALGIAALAATLARGRPLAALLAGLVAAGVQGHQRLADNWPCARDREQVELVGRIVSPAEARPGRLDFDFAPDAASRQAGVPRLLRLSWYDPTARPRPGDHWRFAARLRCRDGFANPGGYERELDLLRKGYGATGYLATAAAPSRLAAQPWQQPVAAARAWIGERIETAAGHTGSAGVLQGLSVGLRGSIDPAIQQAFVDTGTAHLIAISGLHVTAFAVVALWLSQGAYRLAASPRLSRAWPALQAGTVCAVTAGYGLLAGASLPTVRTVAMVTVALALRAARRHAPVADLLAASALLLTAADPAGVTSAGFWLSFVAVAALLGLVEHVGEAARALRQFVRAQLAVTVVLAPVLVGAFGGVPLAGPLVNAVAIPFFSFVLLPATLSGTALLPVWPTGGAALWAWLGELLDRCWPALQWAAAIPGGVLRPPAAPLWLLAAGSGLAVGAVVVPGRSLKCLAAVALAAILWRPPAALPWGHAELVVLDVGQGLATVLRTARRTLVFDTGPRWRSGGAAAAVTVVPYLRSRGLRQIDLVVVSHPDADHAGGLDALRSAFPIGWTLGDAGADAIADEPCTAGRRWRWDGVEFTVVHPPRGHAGGRNDASCALRVEAAGGSVLLLADPERDAERQMLSQGLAADAVIVPHHGSRSSSSPELVAAVDARWALVSAGFGNRWGLPKAEVVQRWRASGAELATTAAGGALTLRIGAAGAPVMLESHRLADPRWWRRR